MSTELIRRGFASEQPGNLALSRSFRQGKALELEKAAERLVLSEYGPAWVIVNEDLEIIHSRGDTSPYLQLPPGRATFALLKMARERIRGELRELLTKAKSEDGLVQSAVFEERAGGGIRSIRLEVRRITDSAVQGSCFLVLFFAPANDTAAPPVRSRGTQIRRESKAASAEIERLKQELMLTSQRMQSVINERDSANQDLTSANEEIQSSNEELQSINEELETSKEELQSSNEELNTLNEELQNHNRQLSRLGDDLTNLLSSTTIPILMLDDELRIRRVTATAEELLNIRSGDIGRPVRDIRMQLNIDDLEPLVRRVMETLSAEELELRDREGHWHLLRIRPYRTADNRIEGTVLALIDIDQLRRAREFAESVVESVKRPLLVLRSDLRVRMANRSFRESYSLQPAEIQNRLLFDIGGGQWNIPALRNALEQLPASEEVVKDIELEQEFAGSGRRTLLINAHRVQPDGENQILVAVDDITAQKREEQILIDEQERLKVSVESGETALHESEAALLRSRNELRALSAMLLHTQGEERRRVSRELHDDLSQKMAKLQFDLERLEQHLPPNLKEVKKRLAIVRGGVEALSNDVRRIAYELHPAALDHLGLAVALRSYVREFSEREKIPVVFAPRKVPSRIPTEVGSALYRIVQESLRNIVKHAGKASVKIALTGGSNQLSLSIRDNGTGFDARSAQGKGGLGLISMQERTRLIHGDFSLETLPGRGVTIKIRVPLSSKGA